MIIIINDFDLKLNLEIIITFDIYIDRTQI